MDAQPGTLYVVATPIGNLEDITLRALGVLKTCSIVAAEDTRHTRKLLTRHLIHAPKVTSYHDHNKEEKAPVLIERLKGGASVALVSDAGTPLIADPGYFLVSQCHEQGVPVSPLPGPCAVTTALSACGLPTDGYCFIGYLPNRGAARRKRLEEFAGFPHTVVMYETPHRILKALADIRDIYPGRHMAVCRELTKQHEEIARGTPEELLAHFSRGNPKGEFTLVVEGLSRRLLKEKKRAEKEAKRARYQKADPEP